ncbi:AAA family ATPase [Paracoccus sp. EGI L200073]|nr:AAA family ATPase [Paracoccus salsus]
MNAVPSDRTVLAVAGAPGSGKSTLAEALVARLPDAVLVPMDGFHLDDRVLEERGLLERKGAVETFDAEGFAVLAGRLAQPGGDIVFPVFDRSRELAVAGAGVVAPSHRVVVVEGNYLLLDRPPWNRVRYDLSVWLDVPLPELRRRLEARWHALGKDEAGVAAHLANDLANAQIASTASRAADVVLVGEVAHQEPGQG